MVAYKLNSQWQWLHEPTGLLRSAVDNDTLIVLRHRESDRAVRNYFVRHLYHFNPDTGLLAIRQQDASHRSVHLHDLNSMAYFVSEAMVGFGALQASRKNTLGLLHIGNAGGLAWTCHFTSDKFKVVIGSNDGEVIFSFRDLEQPAFVTPEVTTKLYGPVIDLACYQEKLVITRSNGATIAYDLLVDPNARRKVQCAYRVGDMLAVDPEQLLRVVNVRVLYSPKLARVIQVGNAGCDVITVSRSWMI